MEASLARKRANPVSLTNGADGSSTQTAASSGAMDSLLEKLRAAAPQARDQRDRRRRARLKERHQVRVASGQRIPEISVQVGENADDSFVNGELTPEAENKPEDDPAAPEGQASASEDVADRAASLLQGLRESKDSTDSRTRRRDSAEEARRARRMRRRVVGTTLSKEDSQEAGNLLPTVLEPEGGQDADVGEAAVLDSPKESEAPALEETALQHTPAPIADVSEKMEGP